MDLGEDLLKGASRIAEFAGVEPRTVYHWADQPTVPVFRVGQALYARKSELDRFFTFTPNQHTNDP